MSFPTVNKLKPINNSATRDHLLHCNYLFFFFTLSFWLMRIKKLYYKLEKAFL